MEVAREGQNGFAGALLKWVRSRLAAFAKNRGVRRMELVETLQLGGKRQLMLVLCDGQRVLVGTGGDSVQSIAEMRGWIDEGQLPAAIGLGLEQEEYARTAPSQRERRCS